MSLSGKTVLITGASSGIGAALAREYSRRGAHLILTARRLDRLEALATELRKPSQKVLVFAADVSRESDMKQVVPLALKEVPSLDIVIANAGFGVVGPTEKLTIEDFQRQFETNVYGVLRTLYATLDGLKKSRGRFAVVGSMMGYFSLKNSAPYSMSKFAVRALCDSLRFELAPKGVSVTHIAPGFIATEIRKVDNQGEFKQNARDPVPLWAAASPERAARIIVRAIQRRRVEKAVTFHAAILMQVARHFPRFGAFLISLFKISARATPD